MALERETQPLSIEQLNAAHIAARTAFEIVAR